MRRYYEILGLSEDADEKQIKQAYRRKAAETHPDKNPDDPQAADKFKEVKEAYECLSDPERRQAYDETGDTSVETGNPSEDLFVHLLNEVADQHDTVFEAFERIKFVLKQMIEECQERKFQTDQEIVKINGLVTKFQYRGKGANLLEAVYAEKLASLSQTRKDIDTATNAAKGAYDLIKDYLPTDKPFRWTDVDPFDVNEEKFLKEMGILGSLLNGPGKRRRGGFPGTGV